MKKILLTACFLLSSSVTFAGESTDIIINNPKSANALLEIKCDFQYKLGTYKFFNRFWVMKKSNSLLPVPYGMKNCEIWVIDVKVF
jgi:hypothetical protein